MSNYLSVSSLTKYLKLKFDKDPYLERVYLTGQVSNFRKRPNHQYFSLKDEKAVIQATVWAGVYRSFGFELEEGMKINVIGRIQLYEPSGSYSIVIEKAEPDGVGALAIQFEQLKKKLQEEGLFMRNLNRPFLSSPRKSGLLPVRVGPLFAILSPLFRDAFLAWRFSFFQPRYKERELPKKLSPIFKRQMIGWT